MPSIECTGFSLQRRLILRGLIAALLSFRSSNTWSYENPLKGMDPNQGPYREILAGILRQEKVSGGDGLHLELPNTAENGAVVPVTLSADSAADAFYLLAEGNPTPLLAEFHFSGSALPRLSLRIKLNQSGPVDFLAKMNGGWRQITRTVLVAKGGCG
jgi:sulfur-oxidizing protein SoxY